MIQTPTLEQAWHEHRALVYGICRRFVRTEDDAHDLVQDVFLHLHKNLHHYRGESRFSTWLHRVTVNFALMNYRKSRRRQNDASLDDLQEQLEENGSDLFGKAILKDDPQLQSVPERMRVQRALSALTAQEREILFMVELNGNSCEEMAAMFDTSIPAMKARIYRARLALREELQTPSKKPAPNLLQRIAQHA